MNYFNTKESTVNFDETIIRVTEELQKEGFGILTEIDVQATMKKKLNVEFRKYRILGACNPPFAFKALSFEPNIGVLLPCNIVVQELEHGKTQISAVNPLVTMQSVNNSALEPIAAEISEKLQRVLAAV
ncbi:MAG: DUF302 domain-containing protein [Ignavibacteriales bacterium]|nr:DUF302 domain-containing protein [Ignavibacteriales bacterium]